MTESSAFTHIDMHIGRIRHDVEHGRALLRLGNERLDILL